MPHQRQRFAKPHLIQALSFSPIVGLIGQRQVGKTTLVEEIGQANYKTLDDDGTLATAQSSPQAFLEHTKQLLVIDECQKAPPLFPALKLNVQKNKRPGQYLLTGSIRFTARKIIQESLTGRIVNIEMLPLTIAEMHHLPLNDFTNWIKSDFKALQKEYESRKSKQKKDILPHFLKRGGLPGIWFLRQDRFIKTIFKAHLETLLQRDIRLIVDTTVPFENLLELLRYLALHQGEPFQQGAAVRASQISVNTLKKIISAFENMFLIRRVLGMDYIKAPIFYLEDQGMASYLAKFTPAQDLRRFAFSQLFAQAHYQHMSTFDLKHYETKSGSVVPFVFKVEHKHYGFLIAHAGMTSAHLRTAEMFLKNVPNSDMTILDNTRDEWERISTRIIRVPIGAVI